MYTKPKYLPMLLLAIFAAVFATICDGVHVYTGTLSYPDPYFFKQGIFVFPGFVVAFFFMALVYSIVFAKLPDAVAKQISLSKGNFRDATESFSMFVLVYILSGFGHESLMFLNVVFYGLFFVRLAASYERTFILLLAIVLGIGGTLGEGLMAHNGLVAYSKPEIFYVPFWLGGLYMHGAFALRELMKYIVYSTSTSK
jgi:hypothetical protein